MMRLLYIENTLAIHGGIERVLVDKLNWLIEYGSYEVCLLTANQSDHPFAFPLHPQVTYHDLGIQFHQKYRYSGWKRICKGFQLHKLFQQRLTERIQEYSPQVIICTRLDYVYDVIKVKGNIPLVFESHDSCLAYRFERDTWLRRMQILFLHWQLRRAQMVVSLTQNDAKEWLKRVPHVQVIPNIVHLNETERYSDCCSKSVIFVGRYSYQKDIRTLLKIWEQVQQRHPDWSLHIFGGYGDEQETLPSLIQRMGMNIVAHEPTSTIFEEYLRSSMLLMTSRYEPFGLVLPEAMSCGLPVIAFDCPYGPADIITHEIDGFLVPERDVNRYVEYVCQLIESLDLRQTMGAAGIKASQRYQADKIMPQWQKLFASLTSKEPSSKRIG